MSAVTRPRSVLLSGASRPAFGSLLLSQPRRWRRQQQQQPFLCRRRCFSTSRTAFTSSRRTQDFGSGFASSYDPSEDSGRGPMFNKAKFGVPQFYPRDLKKRVDDYVIGQERAKKIICATIFNHYQRLRRKHYHEDSDRLLREKLQRQRFARDRDLHERHRETYPDDEFEAQSEQLDRAYPEHNPDPTQSFYVPEDPNLPQRVRIDKSNLLLLGPTGVGKTYILETLSKKLNVPFTISDCNSFTQAGYIGQDVETCIERLLIEANYDTTAAEYGIVVLDEFDKIARRETVHGRDVGGEGVQQALLKLVEGTRVTVSVKDNRSSRSANPITSTYGAPSNAAPPTQASPPSSGKVDQYTIDTSNILFVFSGAFVGLDNHVIRRVAKPSMGFGSELRSSKASSLSGSKAVLPAELYAHLPHHPAFPDPDTIHFTPLDLASPLDLQAFGFIPELIGRVHNICALSPLSLEELYRILTEPRNCLVEQYTSLFETYPSRLRFTRRALHAIAKRAATNETGARGLKMEMERVLAEPMFDAPMPYVLITEACVEGKEKAGYWGKDGRFEIERRIRDEDEGNNQGADALSSTFEQLRQAGQSGA
ncbi:ATPase AAA-2 [Niveomyces insectorum RCEF 264]|uniref:ATPase AAA-2 n=1 Tax=Niveomyces insectorum RCEF 264 TaxID=1081102 RepID=A0A162JDF1_9HYPO|nr:ATPase AAA-2 [Niveomyces insectorum RCEF 264]